MLISLQILHYFTAWWWLICKSTGKNVNWTCSFTGYFSDDCSDLMLIYQSTSNVLKFEYDEGTLRLVMLIPLILNGYNLLVVLRTLWSQLWDWSLCNCDNMSSLSITGMYYNIRQAICVVFGLGFATGWSSVR